MHPDSLQGCVNAPPEHYRKGARAALGSSGFQDFEAFLTEFPGKFLDAAFVPESGEPTPRLSRDVYHSQPVMAFKWRSK